MYSSGGTVLQGSIFPGSVSLPYPGGLAGPNCTALSVQVLTSGFVVVQSNTPLTVPPGAVEQLFVNVTVPRAAYTGVLSIAVTVASS